MDFPYADMNNNVSLQCVLYWKRESHTVRCTRNKRLLSPPQDYRGFLSDSKNLKLEFTGQGMEGNLWLSGVFTIFQFKKLPQISCDIYKEKYHP